MSSIVCLAAFLAACGTAPAPVEEGEFASAPAGETAAMTADSIAAGSTAPAELVYAQSPAVQHAWRRADGSKVSVSMRFSISAEVGNELAAAQAAARNWPAAEQAARTICEGADLFEDEGLMRCEDELQEQLTAILFAETVAHGAVERVIWDRLVWR